MSFVRYGDESDVYVYEDVDERLLCCSCKLLKHGDFHAVNTNEMIEHLREHRRRGHIVPRSAFQNLSEFRFLVRAR